MDWVKGAGGSPIGGQPWWAWAQQTRLGGTWGTESSEGTAGIAGGEHRAQYLNIPSQNHCTGHTAG